jgi:hypothetical protein
MKSLTAALLTLFACAALAQDGWKKPETVVATYVDSDSNSYTILKADREFAVRTTLDIDGALGGVPRIEAVSSRGVFTWLESRPEYALQLPMPTAIDAISFLSPPRFSRADLEFNLKGIEAALKKPVRAGKTESIAGRECLVLTVLDRPDSGGSDYQLLWIDKETGYALKVQDFFRGQMTYERVAQSIKYNSTPETLSTSPKSGATIIKGCVSADTLLRLPDGRGFGDLGTDIEKINASEQSIQRNWAKVIAPSGPFRYAQTGFRKYTGQRPAAGSAGESGSQRRQSQLSDGLSFEFQTIGATGSETRLIAITADRALPVPPPGSDIVFVDDRGNITRATTGSQSGGGAGSGAGGRSDAPVANVAKSDFVDPKTGETVTLIQALGVPAETFIGPYAFGTPKSLENELKLGRSYTVTAPYKMTVVCWKLGEISYALVSTTHSEADLIAIARNVR